MANTKISGLTAATTPVAGTEVLPIVQSSATKQVSVANLTAGRSVSGTSFVVTGSTIPANGIYLPAANAVGIASNTTNAIYIDASQNVGVNTSSPQTKLSVETSGTQNTISPVVTGQNVGVTYGGMYTVRDGAGDQRGLVWQVYTANVGLNEKMRLSSAGIVTMSAYGVGTATFSSAGVISSVSDATWKIKDGVPVDPDSMLKKLEPGYWYYNEEKKETFGSERQLGFYAQNVNAAIGPEAAPEPSSYISKDLDGNDVTVTRPWGYYDRSVLAITVMSLQKALATIESLTARIEALEAKNP